MSVKTEELEYRVGVQEGARLTYIDDPVTSLGWEETEDQLAQRCTLSVANELISGRRVAQLLPNGADIRVLAGDPDAPGRLQERFRGTVFRNHSSWAGERSHDVTAYDAVYYWLLSEDDQYFPAGLTGKQMLTHLAHKWEVPVGRIDGPDVELGKKALRGLTIGAMAERILGDSRRQGAGRWLLRAENGKLNCIRRGSNEHVWHFEQDSMISADIDRSIENIVTFVKVVGREKGGSKVLATATSELEPDFGHFQRIVNRADYDSPTAAKRAALHLLRTEGKEQKTRTIVAPDVPGLRRGDRVFVEGVTMQGYYIASAVFHDAPSRTMTFDCAEIDPDEVDVVFKDFHLEDWIPPDERHQDAGLGAPGAAQPAAVKAIQKQLREGFTGIGRHDLADFAESDDFFIWIRQESGWNPGAVSPANNNGKVNGGLAQFWAGHSWAVPYFTKGVSTSGSSGNRFTMSVAGQAVAMCTHFTLTPSRIQSFAAAIRNGSYGGWG